MIDSTVLNNDMEAMLTDIPAPTSDPEIPMPLSLIKPAYHATVHDIPLDERPRERLQKHGAEMLTTAELLAIILRTGTQRENVIEVANKLITRYGGLAGLVSADLHELGSQHGLGPAKASQLKAALEIGKRLSVLQTEKRYQIRSADDAARLVRMELMYLDHEEIDSPRS